MKNLKIKIIDSKTFWGFHVAKMPWLAEAFVWLGLISILFSLSFNIFNDLEPWSVTWLGLFLHIAALTWKSQFYINQDNQQLYLANSIFGITYRKGIFKTEVTNFSITHKRVADIHYLFLDNSRNSKGERICLYEGIDKRRAMALVNLML